MADRDRPAVGAAQPDFGLFAKRALFIFVIVVLALMAWSLARLLLAIFAGFLVSVMLRNLSARLGRLLRIPLPAAMVLVIVLITAFIAGAGILFGAQLVEQFQRLFETLPRALSQIEENENIQVLLGQMEDEDMEPMAMVGQALIGPVADFAVRSVEVAVGLLLILLIGIFLSATPDLYREGIVRLAPVSQRARTRQVLIKTDRLLWQWLVGQFVAMIFVGAVTTAGLMLLGAPMALALGLLTGLLNFVPVVGPIVASVPAIMVSFTEGPRLALYVLILYVVVQQVESYVVMPLIQRWAVALPPVLAVVSAIAAGILFGMPGVVLAVPLVVMVMGLVQMIYVDVLLEGNEPGESSGTEKKSREPARGEAEVEARDESMSQRAATEC